MKNISVICTVDHKVSINVPSLLFKCEWSGKGSSRLINQNTLEQLMFDTGVRYMFDTGILYIEDMSAKKRLGLEPEDADSPTNIIILNDEQKRDVLSNYSYDDFVTMVDKLSIEQVSELAQYAIDNMIMDYKRSDYIKNKCGRDIINSIRLARDNMEG